jgi:hypothetical protein
MLCSIPELFETAQAEAEEEEGAAPTSMYGLPYTVTV